MNHESWAEQKIYSLQQNNFVETIIHNSKYIILNKMHFRSATLKLTLFYILIAMAVSVSFSIAIYNISSNELERGFGRQTGILRDISLDTLQNTSLPDFEKSRLDLLTESDSNLKNNLIYFNLLILLLSSGAGYFLARKTLRPLEETMEAQSRFTADASHELRTPITAMRTEIEVALRDKMLNFSSAKKLLQSNLEETSKLESLSNALLKLTNSQADVKKTFHKVALSELIIESYEKVESLADHKSIKFETNLYLKDKEEKSVKRNTSSDIEIQGDKQSLIELFVILLDNAIKYSPEKSTIKISVDKADGHALIKIKDQGMGIKACDLPHIFDRFYRADHSRCKEKISGYGLGLSIAKNIADLHGGSVSAKSEPGKGSEFVVKLRADKS